MGGFGLRLLASHLLALGLGGLAYVASAGELWAAVATAVASSALFSALLAWRRSGFLRRTGRVVQALAHGDYSRRLGVEQDTVHQELVLGINAMAHAVEDRVAALEAEGRRMRAVLAGMREGIMVLGEDGRIVLANPALVKMFPGAAPAMGRLPIEVAPCPELQAAVDAALADRGGAGKATVQIEPGGGKSFEVSLARPEGGSGLGAVLVFHDLTQLKRLDAVRRDFVANVSHELRTPLTAIKGYSETLLGEGRLGAGEGRKFLEIILKNANRMSRMVEELLTLARMEDERQPLAAAVVPASDALQAALRECHALALGRKAILESLLPEGGPLVLAEAGQVTQVFRNLLENAVKYAPEGGRVLVSHEALDGQVVFRVEDMGPGVPEAERQRVFERFYRAGRPRGKAEGGTGLGLAIAKHIVERHGGRIWVEQARPPMAGAAFCFSLPAGPHSISQEQHVKDSQ